MVSTYVIKRFPLPGMGQLFAVTILGDHGEELGYREFLNPHTAQEFVASFGFDAPFIRA